MNEEVSLGIRSINYHNFFSITKENIYFFIKRFFDIVIGFIGCLILVPVYILIRILYILNKDYHRIIYKQIRIGKNGKEFNLYKFRTMVPNADKVLKKILKKNKELAKEYKQNHKFENDPRITKVGEFLRISSLDELPQFVNILKGDMTLIGPRPLVIGELDKHKGNRRIYESVRPGITGWWACNGRSNLSYKERLELEYYYVKHQGFRIDIKCIFKTIAVIFKKTGAK